MATAVQVESLWNGITDTSGNALTGGKVFTYSAGTTTPVALFTTSDKSVQATNPIILDSSGKAQVYADGRYKFVIKTAADATLYTLDNLLYGFDDSRVLWGGLSTGSANTQAVSVPDILASYSNGQRISFVAGYANTGAMTLNINSLGAVSIVKGASNTPLASGDIVAGQLVSCTYYGGAFKLDGDLYPAATANIPMGGFKHTNCANATADTEYTTLGQIKAGVTIQTNGANGPTLGIQNYNTGNVAPRLEFYKSRNGTVGGNTIVQNGDGLGGVWFYGASGTTSTPAAAITCEIDGVPGATNDMPGRLVLWTTADGSGTLTERIRITNAGNIGIGTTPTERLDVNGVVYVRVSSAPTFDSGTRFWALTGVGAQYDSFNHVFNVGSSVRAEAMRISSGGYVSIGTSSVGSILTIQNNINNTNAVITAGSNVAGDAGTAGIIISKKDNNSTTSQSLIQFLINGGATGSGQINANGALQAAFGSYSDVRLKENITDLPNQLEKITALRPVEFDYIDGSGHQIGFIAQEVQDYYPDLVAENKDGYLMLSGLGKNEARLIKAIQELAARVEALEAQLP